MACPRASEFVAFEVAGPSHPYLPLICCPLWFPIDLSSSEDTLQRSVEMRRGFKTMEPLFYSARKSSSTQGTLEVGKGGLPPLLSKRAIRNSGGKPPFPTTNMLPSLVSHKALELGSHLVFGILHLSPPVPLLRWAADLYRGLAVVLLFVFLPPPVQRFYHQLAYTVGRRLVIPDLLRCSPCREIRQRFRGFCPFVLRHLSSTLRDGPIAKELQGATSSLLGIPLPA